VPWLKSISIIRSQSAVKDHRKMLHELATPIAKEPTERKIHVSASKRLLASITVGMQSAGRDNTRARKPANGQQDI
jgi:hypothetical protein